MTQFDPVTIPAAFSNMPTFVRVVEVWTPDGPDGVLRLASGLYGNLAGFAAVSGTETFARGEGLPGKAWAEARPVILKGFRDTYFKRTDAAEAAGLTAAVAIPVFRADTLTAVVTFFFADDDANVGAVEVWAAASDSSPMALEDGYYGQAEHFEWISRHTAFPRGSGLPGSVWATGAPVVFHDLGGSHRFIRAQSAAQSGLTAGLGLPVPAPAAIAPQPRAVTLLSALGTPFARQVEIWATEDGREYLPVGGFGEDGRALDTPDQPEGFLIGDGTFGQVAQSGVPVAETLTPIGAQGLCGRLMLPIHDGPQVRHLVVWYF